MCVQPVDNFQQPLLAELHEGDKPSFRMTTGLTQSAGSSAVCAPVADTELFRARFQRSLRNCVRRRFSVAECFGVIWLETLEEVRLTDQDQAELYDELIRWAKYQLFPEIMRSRLSNVCQGRETVESNF